MNFINSFNTIGKKIKHHLNIAKPEQIFPLNPELPLPEGVSEQQLFNFLATVLVSDAPPIEMANYCRQDFRRFVYTYGMTRGLSGDCLELGANPYFTTILLQNFTDLKLTLANYFGDNYPNNCSQEVRYKNLKSDEYLSINLSFHHFNIESDIFPFNDQQFDVILFCEILEHLLMNPVGVLKEIKRILKPNGALILTTPNVSRLENVARMMAGANIYDPYSGYGPYGRHNREYNKHEIYLLLQHVGFSIDSMFTADVHSNEANNYHPIANLEPLLKPRELDLGQYIFVRALNTHPARNKKPAFLYRSYPSEELE
ncbi:class I SAM-dependent methyltransferase [Anabaena sp. CS-542/02]|uniref:class I SAM-dependent methyltransferase n=1 Tax=Anabaena sp. CS-542/02 TaxID=3021719 RepID=UPI00232D7BE8|nr:methyltransferase domain-containing protein [Anabaena sp. CS-542/02]MDB9444999.1 methyltransferase domain-containing protein [Anabaena sp. CS-542/02]